MITIKKTFIYLLLFFIITSNSQAIDKNQSPYLLDKCFTSTKYESNKIKYKVKLCFNKDSLDVFEQAFFYIPNENTIIDAGTTTYGEWYIKNNMFYLNNTNSKLIGTCNIHINNTIIEFKKCPKIIEFLNEIKWHLVK